MLFDDTYRTIEKPAEGLFRDRGSKFLAFAYPLNNESELKEILTRLKSDHPKANHHCWAFRLGIDRSVFRLNDDGEPSGTAGRPILNTLLSKDLTNIVVVVVRYFGGTLLGVPGLINAYKPARSDRASAARAHGPGLGRARSTRIPGPRARHRHKRRLARFMEQIIDCTECLMVRWETRGDGEADIHAEMTQVTLSIVSRTLLGTDAGGDFAKISDALVYLMKGLSQETTKLLKAPKWLPVPFNIRMKKNRAILDKQIYDIIAERRRSGSQQDDLLTMLMEVEDADTAERMTDVQLRDEVITIFLAGHETTANAMSFALYLVAAHPEAGRRIAEEVMDMQANGGMTYENLHKLDYTTRAVKEAMRLYPPAWIIGREATADVVIGGPQTSKGVEAPLDGLGGGYQIRRGDTIMMFPYLTHRDARYWEDPLRFDPDRFLPDRMKDKPRYAYYPFGGGARLCIGNNFAMMEMQIMLALLCSRFEFEVPEGFTPELEALVTLRPKGSMPLNIRRRRRN